MIIQAEYAFVDELDQQIDPKVLDRLAGTVGKLLKRHGSPDRLTLRPGVVPTPSGLDSLGRIGDCPTYFDASRVDSSPGGWYEVSARLPAHRSGGVCARPMLDEASLFVNPYRRSNGSQGNVVLFEVARTAGALVDSEGKPCAWVQPDLGLVAVLSSLQQSIAGLKELPPDQWNISSSQPLVLAGRAPVA